MTQIVEEKTLEKNVDDIRSQINVEAALRQQLEQMQAIVENLSDGVITTDKWGVVTAFNRAAEEVFGYSRREMKGRNVSRLIPSQRDHHILKYRKWAGSEFTGRFREVEGRHKDGTAFPIEIEIVEVQQSGEISFIGIVRDLTEKKRKQDVINQLAFYDPLTQLPNRRLLLDRLQHVISSFRENAEYAALVLLDVDNFKDLNDSAGHAVGDLLLYKVAERLRQSVPASSTVARLGCDEFVALVENVGGSNREAKFNALTVAKKIVGCVEQGIDLDGLKYNCSASVGITLFNDAKLDRQDLLKQADLAMYESKAAGPNSISFFNPAMQVIVDQRIELERDLHRAMQTSQFQLFYQKQVDHLGQLIGAEALLRWEHPEKGFVSPAEFIPAAEAVGLIIPIGEFVLRHACETLARWSFDPVKAGLTLAVNISVDQFNKQDIVKTVLNALEVTGADPSKLKLEITESLLANNVHDVKAKMVELQSYGISFSIDDFGTGYSSLFYLKQLPINQLKIDQSFVKDIVHSSNDQAIAQAVITLAEAMELNVIAEGVETEEQRELLESMGCKNFQGYLFGRPCALRDFDSVVVN